MQRAHPRGNGDGTREILQDEVLQDDASAAGWPELSRRRRVPLSRPVTPVTNPPCAFLSALLLFERTFEQWLPHLPSNRNLRLDVAVQRPGRGWRPVSIAAWPAFLAMRRMFFATRAMPPLRCAISPAPAGFRCLACTTISNLKTELLYLIQKHTFSTIVDRLRERLDEVADPADRIRMFILNHLEYFLANQKAMKVLSHEDDVLKNGFGSEIAAIKREYYRICVELLDGYKAARGLEFSSRTAVLSLFGMMNWIYTWYNPRVDADAAELAREMGDIFLQGIGTTPSKGPQKKRSAISG